MFSLQVRRYHSLSMPRFATPPVTEFYARRAAKTTRPYERFMAVRAYIVVHLPATMLSSVTRRSPATPCSSTAGANARR